MHFHHLERKGWSKQELEHAQKTIDHAESIKHRHVRILERLHIILLVAILSFASVGVMMLLMPVLIFGNLLLNTALLLLLGVCMGLLYAHSESHHELGIATLCIVSFIGIFIIARAFDLTPVHLALPYLLGIVGAYFEYRHRVLKTSGGLNGSA